MSDPTPPFQFGDIVSLKSGRLLMTVEFCHRHKESWIVRTVWFDHENHTQRDGFDAVSLQQWKAVDHE